MSMILGVSFSLELSEMVLTKHRNSEETGEVMTSGSSQDTPSYGVSKVSKDRIKTMLKVCNCLVQKE